MDNMTEWYVTTLVQGALGAIGIYRQVIVENPWIGVMLALLLVGGLVLRFGPHRRRRRAR